MLRRSVAFLGMPMWGAGRNPPGATSAAATAQAAPGMREEQSAEKGNYTVIKDGELEVSHQVDWYNYTTHPSLRFGYWAFRHLRLIPPEWRTYYRNILRAEMHAVRNVNTNWESFISVVEGYRKAKWVLKKYNCKFDESTIPFPYNNFWEVTTHEERAWAYRRSYQLKELQAIQRSDEDKLFGAISYSYAGITAQMNTYTDCSKYQRGNPVHSMDMKAPRESEVADDEEMSSTLIATIEDDQRWNPALKRRAYEQSRSHEAVLMEFEDMDDDDD